MKYHNTPDGPAPCRAEKRACKYGQVFESEEAAQGAYESSLSEDQKSTPTLSKKISPKDKAKIQQSKMFVRLQKDEAYKCDSPHYPEELEVAKALAFDSQGPLQYLPFKEYDDYFQADSCSSVERITLEDGSVGYFKSLQGIGNNSYIDSIFDGYGVTPIRAMSNEVNAYRIAKAMGPDFERAVPETTIREFEIPTENWDGSSTTRREVGTFQREVDAERLSIDDVREESYVDSVRRAGILDAVLGSQDRHDENMIETRRKSDNAPEVVLIDNSFSLPQSEYAMMNARDFEYQVLRDDPFLSESEQKAVRSARDAIAKFSKEGTMDKESAALAINRIDKMLDSERLHEDYY